MLMDLPPALVEELSGMDLESLLALGSDVKSLLEASQTARSLQHIAQETWSRETLQDILAGRLAIPDSELNLALAGHLGKENGTARLQIASHEDRQLEVYAKTKRWGVLELRGTLDELVHNEEKSQLVYTIQDRGIKNNRLVSWVFERVSLSLVEKLFGHLELSDDLPTSREGNTLTVNFRPRLEKSSLAAHQLQGTSLLDIITIDGVTPHEGYIELDTSLRIPPAARALLQNLLRRQHHEQQE